jgi:hypothetical protein
MFNNLEQRNKPTFIAFAPFLLAHAAEKTQYFANFSRISNLKDTGVENYCMFRITATANPVLSLILCSNLGKTLHEHFIYTSLSCMALTSLYNRAGERWR